MATQLPPPATYSGEASSSSADAPAQSVTAQVSTLFKTSSHPVALAFFMAFKLASLIIYLFGVLFTSNFILLFVVIILLLAFDFWNVKNVAGRLLCGLRWWNEVGADGESIWVFESADPTRPSNSTDSKIFWSVLYVVPLLWLGLAMIAILKLEFVWLTIVAVALVLNLANVVAFTRCDKDARKKWATGAASQLAGSSLLGRMGNNLFGRVFAT